MGASLVNYDVVRLIHNSGKSQYPASSYEWLHLFSPALVGQLMAATIGCPAGRVCQHPAEQGDYMSTLGSMRATWEESCIASQYGVGDGYHGRRTASANG
jgi:hypothetical protein